MVTPIENQATYGYSIIQLPRQTELDTRTGTSTMGTYLENGNLLSMTDPGNRTTAWTYDAMGRRLSTDAPDTLNATGNVLANISRTAYHLTGQVAAVWGDQTNATFQLYDEQNRPSELRTYRTLAQGTQPTAGFDATTWTHHPQRGFLSAKRDAVNQGADYTYTAAGRLASRTWARSLAGTRIATIYSYDAGMLTLTNYSDTTPDVSQTYDPFGRPLQTSNSVSKTIYAYDPATLLLDTETISHDLNLDNTAELTRVIDRKNDNLLRPTGFDLKNGATIENQATYTYDITGRLATVTDATSSFTYGYLPQSSLLATVTGPAHSVTNTYDTTRDVLLTKENKVAATVISGYSYSVNALGQRTDVAQSGTAFATARTIAWGYDALGQVTKADASITGLDRAYLYDPIGNRLKSANDLTLPVANNYVANSLNQYTTVNTLAPAYDPDGNATAYPLPAQPTANSNLVWDAENRLIQVTLPNATIVKYQYDAGSRRISTTAGGATTRFIYDDWNCIAEYTGTTLSKTRLWGTDLSGSMQSAGGVGGLLAERHHSGTAATYYPTYDGNGNVSEYLASNGSITAHFEYDPFGNTVINTGTGNLFNYRFSTKPLDFEIGHYYYGYRWYDPLTGRWLSRDPIEEEGGINLYGFVQNNGICGSDYLGLFLGLSLDFTKTTELNGCLQIFPAFPFISVCFGGGWDVKMNTCCKDGEQKLLTTISGFVQVKLKLSRPEPLDIEISAALWLDIDPPPSCPQGESQADGCIFFGFSVGNFELECTACIESDLQCRPKFNAIPSWEVFGGGKILVHTYDVN